MQKSPQIDFYINLFISTDFFVLHILPFQDILRLSLFFPDKFDKTVECQDGNNSDWWVNQ